MNGPDLVVVGASAGGVPVLRKLVSDLPADFRAALLIVLHIGNHRSILPELLSRKGPFEACHAFDGERLQVGRILIAPPDHHMMVEGDFVRLTRGPKEHHTRPAIDPLFRSAALSRGPAAIGVVLTGMLDDGTAGLQAIKACGGIAVVQHPDDATEPSMPLSALKYVRVDHCLPLEQIPRLLASLTAASPVARAPAAATAPPEPLVHEHQLGLGQGDIMEHLEAIGRPSSFVCPDCKGGLWKVAGASPARYLCHTGHAFSLRSLQHAQAEMTDQAIWTAIRGLQEKQMLLSELAATERREGDPLEADRLESLARELERHVDSLRALADALPATAE